MLLTLLETSLVEQLLPIERDYFLWINHHRTDFFNTFMYLYSYKYTWIVTSLALLGVLIYKLHWKEVLLYLTCAALIGLMCDYVSAEFIKPFFARSRPYWHPDFQGQVLSVLNYRGGRFGFISNHAANGFGIALFSSLIFRYRYYTITVYLWALTTAYSRVYLGVHFITDVLGGMFWGTIVGLLVYGLYYCVRKYLFHVPNEELTKPLLSVGKAHVVIGSIILTLIYIIVRGLFFQVE